MKSKAPLAMIELLVMVLAFALASAVCLRAVVWADTRSAHNQARDHAAVYAGNAAEILKHAQGDFAQACSILGGSWDGSIWTVSYDDQWQQVQPPSTYTLSVQSERSGHPNLGQAAVTVSTDRGVQLFDLTVSWQEVDVYG